MHLQLRLLRQGLHCEHIMIDKPPNDTTGSREHGRGTLIAIAGVLVLSFDALLVRLADTGAVNVIAWRGLLMALSLTIVLRLIRKQWAWNVLRRDGFPAFMVSVGFAGTLVLFVLAVLNTSVANVVVLLTSAPLFAALLSGVFLGEWVPVRTWIAIGLCLCGVLLVFAGSLGSGGWSGDLFALLAALVLAGNLTLLRRYPHLDRLAVVAGGGLLAGLLVLPVANLLAISVQGGLALVAMGLVQMPLALVLIGEATRYIPSAEVSLVLLLEAVLGTWWVWLFLDEQPPGATVAGGGIVLATLAVHAWLGLRRKY